MKISARSLLKPRKLSPNYNNCPKHISLKACRALFSEMGAKPDGAAVGTLGDVIENFAIAVIRKTGDRKEVTRASLMRAVRRVAA